MICRHCNTYNKDDYIYCINCGRKLHSKDLKERVSELKGKIDRKVIFAAAAVVLLALGVLFGTKIFSRKEEPYTLDKGVIKAIYEDGTCHIFEKDTKKATIENIFLHNTRFSFDRSTLVISTESEEGMRLYVYRDGKANVVADNHDKYLLCDDGEKVLYTDADDDSVHIYDVGSRKTSTVLSAEEDAHLFNLFVLSPSGDYLAYTMSHQEESRLYLYSSKGTSVYQIEQEAKALIGVSQKGEIIYVAEDGSIHVCGGSGDIMVLDDYDSIYLNKDLTEMAIRHDDGLYFYKDKKTELVCDYDTARVSNIVTPDNMQRETIIQYNNGKITGMVSHIALDSFDEKYFSTSDREIVMITKNHMADTVVDETNFYIVSDDGNQLYYVDDEGRVMCYSSGHKDVIFAGEEERAGRVYAYDSKNKGVYFTLASSGLHYSDGKTTVQLTERYPNFWILCDDGYFYFTDGSNMYATTKGQEPFMIEEVGEYGEALNRYNSYSRAGLFYEDYDGKVYFIKDGEESLLKLD